MNDLEAFFYSDSTVITLRCCRDWPCHRAQAYLYNGRCGLCKQTPVIVEEVYPEQNYARNRK